MGLISRLKCFFKRILEKISEIFPYRAFLSYFADEMSVKEPLFSEISPALRNSWLRAC